MRREGVKLSQGGEPIMGQPDLVPFIDEQLAERRASVSIIIDDKNSASWTRHVLECAVLSLEQSMQSTAARYSAERKSQRSIQNEADADQKPDNRHPQGDAQNARRPRLSFL